MYSQNSLDWDGWFYHDQFYAAVSQVRHLKHQHALAVENNLEIRYSWEQNVSVLILHYVLISSFYRKTAIFCSVRQPAPSWLYYISSNERLSRGCDMRVKEEEIINGNLRRRWKAAVTGEAAQVNARRPPRCTNNLQLTFSYHLRCPTRRLGRSETIYKFRKMKESEKSAVKNSFREKHLYRKHLYFK